MANGKIIPNNTQWFNGYDSQFLANVSDFAWASGRTWNVTGLGGARSQAQQKVLYDAYKAGRGPLAASPTGRGPHRILSDRGAIAIDLAPRPFEISGMLALARRYGCDKTVPSENWHVGLRGGRTAGSHGGCGLAWRFTQDEVREFQRAIGVSGDGYWARGTSEAVQRWVGIRPDGIIGEVTAKRVQAKVDVKQDGLWGRGTTEAIMSHIGGAGSFNPPPIVAPPAPEPEIPVADGLAALTPDTSLTNPTVDGIWGSGTTRRLQEILKNRYNAWGFSRPLTIDGVIGANTYRALQRVLNQEAKAGLKEDGKFGPASIKALQSRVGVKDDGIMGPETVKALQTRLNSGSL